MFYRIVAEEVWLEDPPGEEFPLEFWDLVQWRRMDELPDEALPYVKGALNGIAQIHALVAFLDELDFPGPRQRISNPRLRFYFTQVGWRKLGGKIIGELRRLEIAHRVRRVKNRKLDVHYRDKIQVAALYRRSSKRKERRMRPPEDYE